MDSSFEGSAATMDNFRQEHRVRLAEHPEIDLVDLREKFIKAKDIIDIASADPTSKKAVMNVRDVVEREQLRTPWVIYSDKDQKLLVCDQMAFDGVTEAICKYCLALLKTGPVERNVDILSVYIKCLLAIWTPCDQSQLMCLHCKESGFLEKIIEELKTERYTKQCEEQPRPHEYSPLKLYLGIVYNCAKGGVNRRFFTDNGIAKAILPYTKSKSELLVALSQMIIAHVIDQGREQTVDAVDDTSVTIQFMLRLLNKAVNSTAPIPPSQTFGDIAAEGAKFSVEEVALALSALSKSSKDKVKIVELGALPLLVQLMKRGDENERYYAVLTVFQLAFHVSNITKIKQQIDMIRYLLIMSSDVSSRIRQVADGALCALQEETGSKTESTETITSRPSSSSSTTKPECSADGPGHIMISYQWGYQKLMKKVKNYLEKKGHNVWMDVDKMGGSLTQTMAKAVNDASVVLVCVCQGYEDSPNCRLEAEFAVKRGKRIIPLKVEKYDPIDWLGLIIGMKFYIDFVNIPYKECVTKLSQEIGSDGTGSSPTSSKSMPQELTPKTRYHPANAWNDAAVRAWMANNDLNLSSRSLTGKNIVFMVDLLQKAPQFFYTFVYKELAVRDMDSMRKLTNALQNFEEFESD
ncbi:uncharacterized protein LOC144447629 [Glandiceps talaboti]